MTTARLPKGALMGLVEDILGDNILSVSSRFQELTITVKANHIQSVLTTLRDHAALSFKCFVDMTAVDYPKRDLRFEVVYHVLSFVHNHRIRVKILVSEGCAVSSVIPVFPGANWAEREIWDMFGIPFSGHPDLRRLLSDYAFEGHPLRKDFPLTGYVEVRYDPGVSKVVYETLECHQPYRDFNYLSPWEGKGSPLPGDEKATTLSPRPQAKEGSHKQKGGTP